MIFRALLSQLRDPPLLHDYRETNRVADTLAKEGATLMGNPVLFCMEVPPVCASSFLESNKGEIFFKPQRRKSLCNIQRDTPHPTPPPPPGPLVQVFDLPFSRNDAY